MNRSHDALKRRIAGTPEAVRLELDTFEVEIERYRAGRIPDAVFLERRLRFGVYGQRQDGVHMMRSKHPLGLMTAPQLLAMADVAEQFGHGVAHLTTRQDIQTHFIALERTPDFMRVLDEADMTTREACGNVVRNVTAAEFSGVDPDEAFDVTPHGMALASFLLRHPEGQSLGRKFKVHLASGGRRNLSAIHDLGFTARVVDGQRGFELRVGGGLGAVPHAAPVLFDFLPEAEMLPVSQAVLMIFARHGEKQNRARARLKFLVAKWGVEAFREEVERVRATLEGDWTSWLAELDRWEEHPLHAPGPDEVVFGSEEEARWLRTNVVFQRQPGYAAVLIRVPRGDLSPEQLRGLARLMPEVSGEDTLRITHDQGLLLRWVPTDRLSELRDALAALGLDEPGAGGLSDLVTCPGADTCKLGITSPRSAARHALEQVDRLARDPRLEGLRIRVSGCFNGCAQHGIADIGLYGAARTVNGVAAPHYILLLGGGFDGTFGTTISKVPAARVGDAVEAVTGLYLAERAEGESFAGFARRSDRKRFKALVAPLLEIPSVEEAPELYREPGSSEPFAIVRGKGECAGEVVDAADFLLADADARVEAAQEEGQRAAVEAMLLAARALLAADYVMVTEPREIVRGFRQLYYDTGRIFEGTGHFLLAAVEEGPVEGDRLRRLVLEAELFVEEAHSMITKRRTG